MKAFCAVFRRVFRGAFRGGDGAEEGLEQRSDYPVSHGTCRGPSTSVCWSFLAEDLLIFNGCLSPGSIKMRDIASGGGGGGGGRGGRGGGGYRRPLRGGPVSPICAFRWPRSRGKA